MKMEAKKYFWDLKMNLPKAAMTYGLLVVFIHHDSAKIWGFRYRLTLVIGALKTMAGTGVFVRVVCSLKSPIKKISLTAKHYFYLNKA
jgi:hypothetical protein